jgi:hypothetical protein
MKIIKAFVYILVFFIAGELIVRLDKSLQPFEDEDQVKIAVSVEESDELNLLNKGELPINDSDLRIMILGDSYINGGGIDPSNKFSHQLKKLLGQSHDEYRKTYILDLSRPSNNNLDNYTTYFKFANTYKPNIVLLGYNINDVIDNLDKADVNQEGIKTLPAKSKDNPSSIQKLLNIIYKSELVHIAFPNFNKLLKSWGYIIPKSEFGRILNIYTSEQAEWLKSKALLSEMIMDAEKKKIKFITFIMPEIDLLEHPNIFNSPDTRVVSFFGQFQNCSVINGREVFKGKKSTEYRLSKYDGHPNQKAHSLMANYVYNLLKKTP